MPSLTKVQTGFLAPQGAFELDPGTASAPGLKFSTSAATGMFSPSTGVLGFSTGSTQNALTILGSGNVGIGTTNPIRKLSIYDSTPSAATTTDFILWSDGTRTSTLNQTGSSYSYAGVGSNEMWYYSNASYSAITLGSDGAIPIKFVSGGGERVRITSGGNVGIGTTNPSQKLHVENGSTYLNKYGDNVSNSYGLYVNTTGYAPNDSSGPHYGLRVRQLGARYALNYGIYSEVEDDIGFFGTSTVDGMSLRGCGVYGYSPVSNQAYQESIGVYGKTESLGGWNYNRIYGIKGYARPGVSSFDGTTYYLQAGYGGHFLAHGKGNSIGVYADAYLDASPGAGQKAVPFIAASNGTELMRVESNGNIGIGTTNPITKLDVRNGVITAGSNQSTNGSELLRGYYSEGALTVIGSEHSSGGAVIGYAVKPSTSALGAFLSSTSITIGRGAYSIDGNAHRWYAGSAQTVAENSSVTMNELMRLTTSGNVGIGTTNPLTKLDTRGALHVGGGSDGIWLGNAGDNAAYDNVKLYYTGYNSGSPRIYLTPRTQPGSGGVTTYLHLLSNNVPGPGSNNMGLVVDDRVGIGITTPTTKLHVVSGGVVAGTGRGGSYTKTLFESNDSVGAYWEFQTLATSTVNDILFSRSSNGDYGIVGYNNSTNVMRFHTASAERARLNSGGFASDFVLLSSDNNHQIRSYVDAQKYFDIDGQLGSISYNGTSIGMSSLPGFGISANLYLGGRQPILPSGWTGTISCIGNANSSSLGTQVLLQTSTDGDTWTTRDQTANTWSVTLTWTQTSAVNVPLYVRFRLVQSSGGSVNEGSCRVSDIRITNLYSGPFGFRLSNKLISQYNYQSTTLSSDLTNYQIGLICGSGAFATNNIGHGIAFYSPGVSSSSAGTVVAAINSIDEGSQDAQGLIFCTANSTTGSLSQKLRISNTGNVGIGTTNPIDKLHVQDGRILNFHNVSGTTIHGVVSGYSIGTVATGQTNNANVASNCTYVGFSNDTSTGRTSFRGRFNLTLFGNGTDAAMPVYFTKFGYSGVESGTGGEFHGWIRIATPGSTNPTSYNYSGYNNWANFALQARFDLVHWNAKPHLFAIEYYIPYGRAGIFDIDVSGTQSMFTIWMLPGSYTVEFDACDGLTAHWRNNNNVGGAVDMREASSIVTRSPLAYASRDTRYDSTIMWGSNLVV